MANITRKAEVKRTEERRACNFTLPAELLRRAKIEAARSDRTLKRLLIDALCEHLEAAK